MKRDLRLVVNFEQLQQLTDKFKQAIDEKEFTLACTCFEKIDAIIRQIPNFDDLSQSQIQQLSTLNQLITGNIANLQQESKELIDKIRPFNDNKKSSDLYSGK